MPSFKNTITFLQQRSRVSVSRIIQWTSALWEKPQSIEEFARLSSSPVMAFAPTSCDSQEQLKTIAAMGLATEMIENSVPSKNLYPSSSNTLIGMDFDEIMAKLQPNLPLRVEIYRQFIISITIDYKRIMDKLNSFIQYGCDKNNDLFGKIGTENFSKAFEIAKVLHPHLVRLPKETIEWLKNGKNTQSH